MRSTAAQRHATDELRIDWVAIEQLKLDPHNPRLHADRQVKQIAHSIKAFGFNVPVLADRESKVLAGHGRVHAARRLGLHDIPVIRLEHLTAEQARAFSIADNRLSETSSWDDQLLGEILRDLAAVELNFDLEATGFTMGEIDLRIEGLSVSTIGSPDPADVLPVAVDQPPISRPGDLWQLGRHRLLCGNALDRTSYGRLMQGAVADLVFTDPPYNVPILGHVSGKGRVRHREFLMASGQMTQAQFIRFLATALELLVQHSAAGSLHYVCMDWRHQHELLTAALEVYSEFKNLCVWVKDNAGMGSLYRSQHELIFVFKNGRAPHRNNVELGRHGRNRTNVWQYPSLSKLRTPRGGGKPCRPAPDGEASRLDRRCATRLLGPRRSCARPLSRQRLDGDCCRAGRSELPRYGARPALCRCCDPPLAAVHGRQRRPYRFGQPL